MRLLTIAALLILFAFLAWRSRRNPLFLAGAAAFVALGRSIYVDFLPDQALVDLGGQSVRTGDVLFAFVFAGWLYARYRRRSPRLHVAPRWFVLGFFLGAFLTLELALTLASVDLAVLHPTRALAARVWFYIPLGYLLALDVIRRFEIREVLDYAGVLSLFTTVAAAAYVAAAFGVPVYPYAKSYMVQYGGATIVRDFTTLPIWLPLAWVYFLARTPRRWWVYVALLILAAAGLASYTRWVILALVTGALLIWILMALRPGRSPRVIWAAALGLVAGVVLVVAVPVVAPAQSAYLGERLAAASSVSRLRVDQNLGFRQQYLKDAFDLGSQVDPAFGLGLFDTPEHTATSLASSYDSDWIRIAYRSGVMGVVVFATVLVLPVFWGLRTYRRRALSREALVLLTIGVTAGVLGILARFGGIQFFYWPATSMLSTVLTACACGFPQAATVSVKVPSSETAPGWSS